MKLAGIEAGGTKFVCCIADENGNIEDRNVIKTTTPDETLSKVVEYLKSFDGINAIGIGSFGPIDLDKNSRTYGHITFTPKVKWQNTDILGTIKENFDVPVALDTDVNAAAYGCYKFGEAQGLDTFIYMTVGTGIGVGGIIGDRLMHGLVHPEMGHMFLPKSDFEQHGFNGVCPFHQACFEGLASGTSITSRWGIEHCSELPSEHVGWYLEADYLSMAVANLLLILSPQKVILGGGVMHYAPLYNMIRRNVNHLLKGYIQHRAINENLYNLVVSPALGDDTGVLGTVGLALLALEDSQ